jgi:ABC-type antimicrobial peptide transport system permease subunit
MAIGAGPGDVLRMMARSGLRLALWGGALGLALALALANLLGSLMWEIRAWDPAAFGSGTAVLALAVISASMAPVMRASRVDPAEALRSQ